jgi:uncharacterized protein YvpB/LysM repeat protein
MKRVFVLLLIALVLAAVGNSAASAKQIPDQAYISGFAGHAQAYSLSCESRSAADWAAYWGVNIDETEFLNALPRSDNPNKGFVGDPNGPWGYIPPAAYGVHADPVAELLRAYGLDAHAGTGLSWDELRAEVAEGRPVIVWVIGSIWAGTPRDYETDDGEVVTVANNQHTMVLIGYDENRVHLVDALTGYTITHTLENFLTSWAVLGNMAVIGEGSGERPNSESGETPSGYSYTVQPGDTLNKVAARFDLYWPDLAAWNNIGYPYIIYPGQVLAINGEISEEPVVDEPTEEEAETTYTVQPGEDLRAVSIETGIDWARLAMANNIAPPFVVRPGDTLRLPADDERLTVETPATYTATGTESLLDLAEYFGLDWLQVAARNNLSFPYLLSPGQTVTFE